MSRIVCLGEAMVELSMEPGRPDRARVGYAGDTLNTAIYVKRSAPRLDVAFCTKLGTDPFSDRMTAMMADEGLITGTVLRATDRLPGLYAISTDAGGERSFTYWRNDSAARALFDTPGLDLADIARFDVLYLSAISLAILPAAHRDRLIGWLPEYRRRGGIVAFDSNFRPQLWTDLDTARRCIAATWRQTDIALPSLDDEMALFGDPGEREVLARLAGYGIAGGALKRGADGPLSLQSGIALACEPVKDVIDSTAAGDSFNGGYLAARLCGRRDEDCLAAGHTLAARVIRHRGAILPAGERALA